MKNTGIIAIFSIFTVFIGAFLIFSPDSPVLLGQVSSDTQPIFSIRILDFQSPVKLGEFLEFSYFTRSVQGVNGTAEVNFWIENQKKEIITSGSDTIFLGGMEEKTRTANIFLPTSVRSGIYELHIEAEYQGEKVSAYRTIELNVKGGSATVNFGYGSANLAIIIALLVLAVLNIYIIYHVEKNKIKKILQEEEQFIKRHRVSVLTTTFFLILVGLVYYLNFIGFLPDIPLYYYYLILAFLFVVTLFLGRNKNKKTR